MPTANIAFCPRKTGSSSISRGWAKHSKNPCFHTHDMIYFVVTDCVGSNFFEFVKKYHSDKLSYVSDLCENFFEFTIISKTDTESVFEFFDSFCIVTSVRDPLTRRISELLQALTVDQVNAVIDAMNPTWPRLDRSCDPTVSELCETKRLMGSSYTCPILNQALNFIVDQKNFLTEEQVFDLFQTHFVDRDTEDYYQFFRIMESFEDPAFDLDTLRYTGCDYQTYKIFGKPVRHLLFRLENIRDRIVSKELQKFTGVRSFGREHNSDDCHHLFGFPLGHIKRLLIEKFKDVDLSPKDSPESMIVKGFGY